ncbi:MAG TPA: hypothetical protein VLO10_05365 [Candidatus Deferrimicrobium sp.]|nr:hypothetical protein [Candidatus Deferrimicrobium sp.]
MTRTRHGRRRRQRGQGILEWALLGGFILFVGTTLTVAVGGWAAATYDQQHSHSPLAATSSQSSPPSLSFVDYSPVGLHEDCLLQVAAAQGLTWDGGALGWSAASNPRPRGHDALVDQKVQDWRNGMTALLSAASSSTAWQRCSRPDQATAAPFSPPPAETVAVDGQYTIDPSGTQAVGGCGSDGGPLAMKVSGNGTTVTIYFPGTSQAAGNTLNGTMDTSSFAVQATSTDADGTTHTLRGSFSSNAGVTRFHGTYETLNNTAGCGYEFSAQKN